MISFLIPAYNAERTVGKVIESVLKQDYRCKKEIIVVDDGSTDRTAIIAQSYPKVKLIRKKHTGLGDTRNVCLKHAKGKFVVFLDSDIILEKSWLREIFKHTDFSEFDGATGYVDIYYKNKSAICALDEDITRKRFGNKIKILSMEYPKINYINYLIKRKIFKEIGKFDPIFDSNGEDVDWFHRFFKAGKKCLYIPTAKCHHVYQPPNFLTFVKKNIRVAKASVIYLKYKDIGNIERIIYFFKILFIPLVLIVVFIDWRIALLLLSIGILEEVYRGMKTIKNLRYLPLLLFGRFFSNIGQIKTFFKYLIFGRV